MAPPRLFVSHSWKDKFFVNKLVEQLTARGVDVCVDSAELKVGDSLMQSVGNAIQDIDYFAIVLSHNSVSSGWVQRELQLAMALFLEKKNRRILPILIEKCEIPPFLKDLVYADFTDPSSFDSAVLKVLNAMNIMVKTSVVTLPRQTEPKKKSSIESPSAKREVPTAASKLDAFVDITIAEVDRQRSYKPDPEMLLYNVYLRLSAVPPTEWAQIFAAERQFPRHSMWRRAWIENGYVVINCVPEELKQYHMKDLKEDVENTNSKYRAYLVEIEQKAIRDSQKKEKEKRMLDDAFGNLDL